MNFMLKNLGYLITFDDFVVIFKSDYCKTKGND